MGDYAFPCFTLSKKLKKAPNVIAQDFVKKLKVKGVKEIKNMGPYVNFFVDKVKLTENVLSESKKEKDYIQKGIKADIEKAKKNKNKRRNMRKMSFFCHHMACYTFPS